MTKENKKEEGKCCESKECKCSDTGSKVAKGLGKGLAHFQGVVDNVLGFALKKLKKVGEQEKENEKSEEAVQDDSVKGKVLSGVKKAAGFLGETGSTFFDEYENIKAKQAAKKEEEQDVAAKEESSLKDDE